MDSILDVLLLSCGVRSTSLTICEVRTQRMPDHATTSASQHHLQALQTTTLIQIETFFSNLGSIDQPSVLQCQASIRVLRSCVVNMSSGARHSWEAADVHMQSSQTVP